MSSTTTTTYAPRRSKEVILKEKICLEIRKIAREQKKLIKNQNKEKRMQRKKEIEAEKKAKLERKAERELKKQQKLQENEEKPKRARKPNNVIKESEFKQWFAAHEAHGGKLLISWKKFISQTPDC